MKSNAKAKSFHVAVRGNPPQHVTSPSRTLIRRPATSGWQQKESIIETNINREDSSESSASHQPPTGHQDIESTTIPIRAIRRACRRHGTTNDQSNEPPPRYSQAAGPPPGLHRTNRRDTSKPSGRRRACVERTAPIPAILQQPPGLHPESQIRLSAASGTTVDRGRRRKDA